MEYFLSVCMFAAVKEASEVVVKSQDIDTITTEMPETIIEECLVEAVVGAGVEMVVVVEEEEGETVEEAVVAVVEMEEADVRKDLHMYEDKCNDVFKH